MKSWVEVSAERLRANVAAIRQVAGAEAEILAVIKADAYGHGAAVVAPVLAEVGVQWFGVGDVEEGVRLRTTFDCEDQASGRGDCVHVVVMCGMEAKDAARMLTCFLSPVVWTPQHLDVLEKAAAAAYRRVAVHLEVDSGMARQGARPGAELAALLHRLRSCEWVDCEGVFSHLCASESREPRGESPGAEPMTRTQEQRFAAALEQVAEAGARREWVLPEWVHLANSSAVDEGSTGAWVRAAAERIGARVLVRPGLAIYGYCLPLDGAPGPDGELRARLQPVLEWKTRVIGLREIAAGDTVGYGATFVANRPMRLALLPVGYADGFRREASSGVGDGWVMVARQRAMVVGRVSMNLIVVDVTAIPLVQIGDEVVLLGEGVSAEDHARWCGTIPYEILCGIRAERRLGS